jgi:hypothetical protein
MLVIRRLCLVLRALITSVPSTYDRVETIGLRVFSWTCAKPNVLFGAHSALRFANRLTNF